MGESVVARTVIINILREKGKPEKRWASSNLITEDGDYFMVQRLSGASPTHTLVNCVLGTGGTAAAKTDTYTNITAIAGSNKAPSAGYPKVNDTDSDNTGKGLYVCTWKYEWTMGDFNDPAVREGCITIASPIAESKIFNHWVEAEAYVKTASATLTQYVNVTITGA